MRVEEIALRQEVRQMMTESGINRNTIKEIAEQVLKEEIEKQVKSLLNQTNTNALVRSKINTFEFKEMLRNAIKQEVRDAINISVDVKTELSESN